LAIGPPSGPPLTSFHRAGSNSGCPLGRDAGPPGRARRFEPPMARRRRAARPSPSGAALRRYAPLSRRAGRPSARWRPRHRRRRTTPLSGSDRRPRHHARQGTGSAAAADPSDGAEGGARLRRRHRPVRDVQPRRRADRRSTPLGRRSRPASRRTPRPASVWRARGASERTRPCPFCRSLRSWYS
jgi:hypothetical protein